MGELKIVVKLKVRLINLIWIISIIRVRDGSMVLFGTNLERDKD